MKRSLSSKIIKGTGEELASIQSYSMKDMPFGPASREEKGQSQFSGFHSSSDSEKKVEQLLKEVKEREQYIKQITDKSEGLEKEAYEKGFAQGEKAGMELGEKRFESVIRSFTEALATTRKREEEYYLKNEQEMIALVLAIARRIIQKEVSADKGIIARMIRSALKYVADQEEIKVRLNPSDLDFASQYRDEMIKEMRTVRNIIFESDEEVARGDAIVESNRGIIDAGIEKHLQEVEKALRAHAEENTHTTRMSEEGEGETVPEEAEREKESGEKDREEE